MLNRRQMLARTGAAAAALGASRFPLGWTAAADNAKKRLLVFTKSQAFEHSVVKRPKNDELSLAERIITEMGAKNGFEVECMKDGRKCLPETIAKFDAFFFETTGDLTKDGGSDGQP